MKSVVSIVRCGDYRPETVYRNLKKCVELAGGFDSLKTFGRKALLKPNILFGEDPSKAVTTHPAVVDAAIRLFRENGFEVTVGDSPGLDTAENASEKCGIADVLRRHGIVPADFNRSVSVANPEGLIVKRFPVAKAWTECDFVVSLPKLKTHSQMYYTGAMKNLFGVIPGLQKSQYHLRFPEKMQFADMIVDLNVLLKPRLTILDAVVAMEGQGPSGGEPRTLGLLLASRDVLALDVIACELIGYDPMAVPVMRRALDRKRGDWIHDRADIRTTGENPDSVRCPNFRKIHIPSDIGYIRQRLPDFLFRLAKDLWVPRPFFDHGKCIRCGKCADICSPKALDFRRDRSSYGKRIRIDYEKCIRCYCCHEICPVKAIRLRRLNSLF